MTDFISRAGSAMEKATRLAGFLLIIVVLQFVALFVLFNKNQQLGDQIYRLSNVRPVYVVPGSTADTYRPTSDDMLVRTFTDFMLQSMNTYTYESIEDQLNEVRRFFTPKMLRDSSDYFKTLASQASTTRESQLFIPNFQTFSIEKTRINGQGAREVTIRGSVQKILGGAPVETIPVEIVLVMQNVLITKSNPFGYMLHSMRTVKTDQSR